MDDTHDIGVKNCVHEKHDLLAEDWRMPRYCHIMCRRSTLKAMRDKVIQF